MANRDSKLIERTLKDFSLNISSNSGGTGMGGTGTSQDLLYFFSWYRKMEEELEDFKEIHANDPVTPGMVKVFGIRLKSTKALKDFLVKYGFDLRMRIAGYRSYTTFYIGTPIQTKDYNNENPVPNNYFSFYFNLNNSDNPVYHSNFLGKSLDISGYNWGGLNSDVSLEMFIDRMEEQLLTTTLDPTFDYSGTFPKMYDINFVHEPLIQCGAYEFKKNRLFVGLQEESDRTPIYGAKIVQYQLKDFFDLFECKVWEEEPIEPK